MRWRETVTRVRGAIGLGPADRDLEQELGFHLDMLERRHLERGLTREQAHRAARLELGGSAQIAENWRDQRGLPFLETLRADLGYGLRALRRSPGFTLAALATLALGIGANTAIFTIVDAVLIRPLPYAAADRLVMVGDATAVGASNVGYETVLDWRARSRSFDGIALYRSWQATLVGSGEAERVPAMRVSSNFFDLLGVHPALGRGFSDEEDRADRWHVLLLSDGLWRRRFGADPTVVGRVITMNDAQYRIIGVMPSSYEPLISARYYRPAQLWAPLGYDTSLPYACRTCQHLRALAVFAQARLLPRPPAR